MNYTLYLLLVILIVLVVLIIFKIAKTNKKLRATIIKAILYAEKLHNTTTGQERLELAIDYVLNRIPTSISMFIPKELLFKIVNELVQKIFDETKELLDYRPTEILEESEVVNNE